MLFGAGVPVSLGTDSHTQIDLLEDARELEYHLRLQNLERAVLAPATPAPATNPTHERAARDPDDDAHDLATLAARLFDCATVNGATSIGATIGGDLLEAGRPADFFTVALDDPSIAGAGEADLLSAIVFSLSRAAITDVIVGGRRLVEDGRHAAQDEIVERFQQLQDKLWRKN